MSNPNLILISTVTTAADSQDLVAWETARDEIGVSGTTDIATLKRYVSSASIALSNEANRVFVVESILDEMWPQRDAGSCLGLGGVAPIILSRFPVTSVPNVVVIENGTTLVSGTDYRVDPAKGFLHRLGSSGYPCHWRPCAISAAFSAGYDPIPADLQDITIRMVRNRWNAKDRDPSLVSENIPGVRDARWWVATGNEAGNLPPDVADVLQNYTVPIIA